MQELKGKGLFTNVNNHTHITGHENSRPDDLNPVPALQIIPFFSQKYKITVQFSLAGISLASRHINRNR
ncbi:hypothetical protein AOY81_04485 [Escherichia coli]|nr:hypothetical protein AOY81_04485 [Escherichia coli]